MTRLPRFLTPLVVALAVAAGCTGSSTMVVRNDAPPAHRAERVEYRPGHVYVAGHWERRGDRRWTWIPGYYERERPGFVYIEGRWRSDRGGHVWVDGQWRRREGVVIRERRRQ
ncbi:MAG: YXWGXW repeat-containing protein [Deltaproteobacteria bacterium]|nr:YXWGXW repeat-containing protein [Deltaproteobacteria bacterium]